MLLEAVNIEEKQEYEKENLFSFSVLKKWLGKTLEQSQ